MGSGQRRLGRRLRRAGVLHRPVRRRLALAAAAVQPRRGLAGPVRRSARGLPGRGLALRGPRRGGQRAACLAALAAGRTRRHRRQRL